MGSPFFYVYLFHLKTDGRWQKGYFRRGKSDKVGLVIGDLPVIETDRFERTVIHQDKKKTLLDISKGPKICITIDHVSRVVQWLPCFLI